MRMVTMTVPVYMKCVAEDIVGFAVRHQGEIMYNFDGDAHSVTMNKLQYSSDLPLYLIDEIMNHFKGWAGEQNN